MASGKRWGFVMEADQVPGGSKRELLNRKDPRGGEEVPGKRARGFPWQWSSSGVFKAVGIDEQFVHDVQVMMKPGTSAVLMRDVVGDLEAALNGLKGVGGTVFKTNVDAERAKRLQATLRGRSDLRADREALALVGRFLFTWVRSKVSGDEVPGERVPGVP